MIERNHFNILQEVSKLGSLTAAASSLNLTQSALSHTIKKLEQQIGAKVWEKEGRELHLTQVGRQILNTANRLLPQFEHLEEVVLRMAEGEQGILRIGMECHPCYQWLLKVVPPFLKSCPKIDIDVKQKFKFGGMAALYSYDIDMLVTPDP